MVAGLRFAAVLVELLGADLTAAAGVPDQPDSGGALGSLQGAVAGGRAGGESLEGGEETREAPRGYAGGAPQEGTRVSDPGGRGRGRFLIPSSPAVPAAANARGPPAGLRGGLKEKAIPKRPPNFGV